MPEVLEIRNPRRAARSRGAAPARRDAAGAVAAVVAAIGDAEFPLRLAEACTELYDADQVTVFMLEDGEARCLLAHRPSDQRLVAELCRAYSRSFVGRDQLLWRHRGGEASVATQGFATEGFMTEGIVSSEIGDRTYRSRLFHDVGLAGKVAAIAASRHRTLYINLYYGAQPRARIADTLLRLGDSGRILASCLHRHEDLTGGSFRAGAARQRVETFLGERFKALSPRERAVCALIVCGHSAEAIALELKVSPATVITFRRRAYAKLAIASRGELFAQCAGLAM
ncbi:MAG: helix-turn-helix transcriptional regulator [Xanthobacteraceae bacterium]|nr:helix-turn-helix transcriptional regulator [Xanthobacteraceae bacterium]